VLVAKDTFSSRSRRLDHYRRGVRLVSLISVSRAMIVNIRSMSINRLLDLAITMPMKLSAAVELDHHGVDHHEVAMVLVPALMRKRTSPSTAAKPDREITAWPAFMPGDET